MVGTAAGSTDDESFVAFVNTRSGSLIARATLLSGDGDLARDIVQTVLTRAYPHWRRIRHDDPYGYVNRDVSNAVVDWWRIAHRRLEVTSAAVPERVAAEPGLGWEDRYELLGALARLTARERAVVVMRYLDDLSERQVADALHISPGTVKSTCHAALRKLRVVLSEEVGGGDTPAAGHPGSTAGQSRSTS